MCFSIINNNFLSVQDFKVGCDFKVVAAITIRGNTEFL